MITGEINLEGGLVPTMTNNAMMIIEHSQEFQTNQEMMTQYMGDTRAIRGLEPGSIDVSTDARVGVIKRESEPI